MEAVARKNGLQEKTSIKWAELESTFEPSLLWDIVLCDVVSPQGILRPMVFEEIGSVRLIHLCLWTSRLIVQLNISVKCMHRPCFICTTCTHLCPPDIILLFCVFQGVSVSFRYRHSPGASGGPFRRHFFPGPPCADNSSRFGTNTGAGHCSLHQQVPGALASPLVHSP